MKFRSTTTGKENAPSKSLILDLTVDTTAPFTATIFSSLLSRVDAELKPDKVTINLAGAASEFKQALSFICSNYHSIEDLSLRNEAFTLTFEETGRPNVRHLRMLIDTKSPFYNELKLVFGSGSMNVLSGAPISA